MLDNPNKREVYAALSGEWQTVREVASKVPRHGRTDSLGNVRAVLLSLEKYGYAERIHDARGACLWRRCSGRD